MGSWEPQFAGRLDRAHLVDPLFTRDVCTWGQSRGAELLIRDSGLSVVSTGVESHCRTPSWCPRRIRSHLVWIPASSPQATFPCTSASQQTHSSCDHLDHSCDTSLHAQVHRCHLRGLLCGDPVFHLSSLLGNCGVLRLLHTPHPPPHLPEHLKQGHASRLPAHTCSHGPQLTLSAKEGDWLLCMQQFLYLRTA